MPLKKEVSLLPDADNVNSFSNRLIRWLTTVGRYIIVFTELVVICAFISRFWLDRKNSDLSEVIRQRKAILQSTQDFEQEYNLLQQRLKYVKSFYESQPNYAKCIDSLVKSTPLDIDFEKLVVNQNASKSVVASIALTASKESAVVDFITNLTVNPDIQSVNVENIEKKPKDSKYSVSVSLVFNQSQNL